MRALLRLVALTLAALLLVACGGSKAPLKTPTSRLDVPFAFGAYVDPPAFDDASRIKAFETFEAQLGHRLDVYHSYHPWLEEFPSGADRFFAHRAGTRLLLSWAGTDTRVIVSGRYDALIRARAKALKALRRPVILQWRWEMNRPNLAAEIHSPADYVAAWRHLHRIFDEVHADNVSWAWCPLSDPAADLNYSAYYPGDAWVDWIGANGYARDPQQSFADVFASFLTWARGRPHPILIGEFGRRIHLGSDDSLVAWLKAAGETLRATPSIKLVCYFESANGNTGNYDLTAVPSALEAVAGWGRPS